MATIAPNNLLKAVAEDRVCKALGLRLVTAPSIVTIAKNAGFDSLFIDLEHTTFSVAEASLLCTTALISGLTPFVRVPHQCGNGLIQRVLDSGSMGIIVPHIHNADDARAVVRISKFPPEGKRSITKGLPHFGMRDVPVDVLVSESNAYGSTVILMIETADSITNIEEICQVPGVEVLLIGANDLALELGVPGQYKAAVFLDALRKVSAAARKNGITLALAGIYDNVEFHAFAIKELGVRWLVAAQDQGLLTSGAKAVCDDIEGIER